MIDIGANLCHNSFDEDRDQVVQRAFDAGLEKIIVTGSCVDSVPAAMELAQQYPGRLYSTAGVHPHHAEQVNPEALELLRQVASSTEVVATGEMGLDFFRDYAPRDQQEKAFHKQLELAVEIGKPVFLHQRDAHERFLPILLEYLSALPAAVVHCFTGTREELHAYLDQDLYIGITGWICDERRGHHMLGFIDDIPTHRLMVETDAPYLLPRTLNPRPQSRRNEPVYLPEVIRCISTATNRTVADIATETALAAKHFFNIS